MNYVLLHISKFIPKIFLCKFSFSWLKTHHPENEDLSIQSHHFMANRWGKSRNSVRFHFLGLQKSLWMVTAAKKLKEACSLEENL